MATIRMKGEEVAALVVGDNAVPVASLGRSWPSDLEGLLTTGAFHELYRWYGQQDPATLSGGARDIPLTETVFAPLLRRPRKIWCIGLNYRDHAADLDAVVPTSEPASFMKPDTTIIGPGETVRLPHLSNRVTGEAELGLVFGTSCRDVPRESWMEVLAGFTTIIDMTAEDILRRNPRNLTQCKSFDTFFSVGPMLLTPDEIEDVGELRVRTVHNGSLHAENTVSRMTFPPDYLVWYHTQIMSMLPGDILSTGTPGAAVLAHGDTISCEIDGFPTLSNPVHDLKNPG